MLKNLPISDIMSIQSWYSPGVTDLVKLAPPTGRRYEDQNEKRQAGAQIRPGADALAAEAEQVFRLDKENILKL